MSGNYNFLKSFCWVLLSLFIMPLTSCAQTGILSDVKEKYKNDGGISISFNGDFSGLFGKEGIPDLGPEVNGLLKNLHVVDFVAVSNKSARYSPDDLRRLKAKIRRGRFEELMSVQSQDGGLKVMGKGDGRNKEIVVLIGNENNGFVAMDLRSGRE